MNKKDYNSYLILGVVVLVVVFLFIFSLLRDNNEPVAENPIQQEGLLGDNHDGEKDKEDGEKDGSTPTISPQFTDEQILTSMVIGFNDEWINYVNSGSTELLNYVKEASELESDIMVFDTVGLTETLLDIQVKNVDIQGDTAYIYDYEKFSKVKDGVETIVEYDWVYTAKKVNGQWMLDSFQKAD